MFKTALMIAAALALAPPAQAAIELAVAGSVTTPVTDIAYDHGWIDPAWGKLVISSEQEAAASATGARDEEVVTPVQAAAILPEPVSWATIVLGLAIIGWLARGRRGVTPVSFV